MYMATQDRTYCFIPSWYSEPEGWCTQALPWYKRGIRMEFDDTVNQIRLFLRAGEPVRILLLGSMPELRMFLHREGISGAEIWSVFDRIQGVQGQNPGIFSYRDISWPADLEWMYTPFLALAYREGELYARVEFGEGGHVIFFDLCSCGEIRQRYYVDDRGFLSYAVFYKGGQAVHREYFNRRMQWQMREDVRTGVIRVNPEAEYPFARREYPRMSTLIEEVLWNHFREAEQQSALILASDPRHNEMVCRWKGDRKLVMSFFEQRNAVTGQRQEDFRGMREADLVVADTEYAAGLLQDQYGVLAGRILDISPYDARISLGTSARIRELKILCYLGNIDFEERLFWYDALLRYADRHRHVVLILGLGREAPDDVTVSSVTEELKQVIYWGNYHSCVLLEGRAVVSENEETEDAAANVLIQNCKTETEIIGILRDIRVIADADPKPDLYLQIAGMSAGVPQILRMKSQYVEHQKNGWILRTRDEFPEALDYFLEGLEHWNAALVHSVQKIADYTNGEIVRRWKRVLSETDKKTV